MKLKEFLFEERFAPHLFAGELITPQVTLVRQPTFYGAVKAFWGYNSDEDFDAVLWREDAEEGIVLEGVRDILVLKRSLFPNRFFILWTTHDAECSDIFETKWLVETQDGQRIWLPDNGDTFEYSRLRSRYPGATITSKTWYGSLFDF